MNPFVTCPSYHPLMLGASTERSGVLFTCDACGGRNVDVEVSCRPCAYDVCRPCYFGTRASLFPPTSSFREEVALAERRVLEATVLLNALREREMDEECMV